MSPKQRFDLVYAPQVKQHLKAIERRHYALIHQEIEAQLPFEPEVETRNRKPLRRSMEAGAEWELRFGPGNQFRVFYEVDRTAGVVSILAIGSKERERLYIGGEEVTDESSTGD